MYKKKYSLINYFLLLVLVILLIFLPLIFSSSFALTLLSKMGVLIIFTVAYNMLLGQIGLLSFGHAIYFGLAGYISIHFINSINGGLLKPIPLSFFPVIGATTGLIVGVIVGYLSTRRVGTAFAMISLGFCEMVTAMTMIFVVFFNGEDGVQGNRVIENSITGINYGPPSNVYYLILFWCILCVSIMYFLTKTPFGRISNAIRDNAQRAEFIGYNVRKVRWLAFSLSAMFAGAAGSLHAINYEHIGFESVSLAQSGSVLFMAFIGGIGHFLGPIIGAILLTFLDSTLADITEAWLLYLGLLFIMVVTFAPGGLAGIVVMHGPIMRNNPKLLVNLIAPYMLALISSLVLFVGLTGTIELLYANFFRHINDTVIYWVSFENKDIFPWIIFISISLIGYFLCKKSYPSVKNEWNYVMDKVKNELNS